LKLGHDWKLWKVVLISQGIALFEYCLAAPANRLGYGQFSGFQLKIIQEVITLSVFIIFAVAILKERLAWNFLVAFGFLGMAAWFAFAFDSKSARLLAAFVFRAERDETSVLDFGDVTGLAVGAAEGDVGWVLPENADFAEQFAFGADDGDGSLAVTGDV